MSLEEFVSKYRHEFGGYVFDALTTDARGSALSAAIRLVQRKIDTKLTEMWHDLNSTPKGKQ